MEDSAAHLCMRQVPFHAFGAGFNILHNRTERLVLGLPHLWEVAQLSLPPHNVPGSGFVPRYKMELLDLGWKAELIQPGWGNGAGQSCMADASGALPLVALISPTGCG